MTQQATPQPRQSGEHDAIARIVAELNDLFGGPESRTIKMDEPIAHIVDNWESDHCSITVSRIDQPRAYHVDVRVDAFTDPTLAEIDQVFSDLRSQLDNVLDAILGNRYDHE